MWCGRSSYEPGDRSLRRRGFESHRRHQCGRSSYERGDRGLKRKAEVQRVRNFDMAESFIGSAQGPLPQFSVVKSAVTYFRLCRFRSGEFRANVRLRLAQS